MAGRSHRLQQVGDGLRAVDDAVPGGPVGQRPGHVAGFGSGRVHRRHQQGGLPQVVRVGVPGRVAGHQGADRGVGPGRAQRTQQRGQVGHVVEPGALDQAGAERLGRVAGPGRAQRDEQPERVPPGAEVSPPGQVAGH